MRQIAAAATLSLLLLGSTANGQQLSAEMPPGRRSIGAVERPRGAPQNRWRYRYSDGRWWYWTPDSRWSYYDGNRWRLPGDSSRYVERPVDPALLRLEYKEGVLGRHKWPRTRAAGGTGSGGGLPLSGTQGPLGGAPSGSFTNPAGVPSAMNSSTGTSTGVGGLSAGGRPVTSAPLNGGGAIGGGSR